MAPGAQEHLAETIDTSIANAMNEPVAEAAASERIAADLLEQINAGRSFDELFNRLYDLLHGVVPYHRIAVALLDAGGEQLRLISCRSDGEMPPTVGLYETREAAEQAEKDYWGGFCARSWVVEVQPGCLAEKRPVT